MRVTAMIRSRPSTAWEAAAAAHRHRCGRRNGCHRRAVSPVEQRATAGGRRTRPSLAQIHSRGPSFQWDCGCSLPPALAGARLARQRHLRDVRADDPLPRRHGPRALRLHRRHARPRSRRRRPGGRVRANGQTLLDSRRRSATSRWTLAKRTTAPFSERAADDGVFIATITLLCLNLLIAFLTDAYRQVSEDKDKAFVCACRGIVETGERVRQGILPPLNILQMHASMVGVCTGRRTASVSGARLHAADAAVGDALPHDAVASPFLIHLTSASGRRGYFNKQEGRMMADIPRAAKEVRRHRRARPAAPLNLLNEVRAALMRWSSARMSGCSCSTRRRTAAGDVTACDPNDDVRKFNDMGNSIVGDVYGSTWCAGDAEHPETSLHRARPCRHGRRREVVRVVARARGGGGGEEGRRLASAVAVAAADVGER